MISSLKSWAVMAATLVCTFATQTSLAANGTWTEATGDGTWSSGVNWLNGTIADGAGFTADFTQIDVDAAAVAVAFPGFFRNAAQLDTPRTIGNLNFADSNPTSPGAWEIYSNDTLTNFITLSGASPTITVGPLGPFDTGTEIIDDVLLGVNVASANGFTKNGQGTLTLNGPLNDGLHGTVTVNAGTLRIGPAATFDYETAVDPERTQFHLANGTTLEVAAQVGDIAATGAGVSIAPGATVTLRKLNDGAFGFSEVGGAGATVNIEAAAGVVRMQQNWAAGGALAAVNMTGTTPGSPAGFQLRNNGGGFFNNSFANTPVTVTNGVLSTNTNSGGNLNEFGSLTGDSTSTLEGGASGTVVTYQIGSLNTNTTFAGAISTGAGGINIFKVGTGKLTLSGNLTYTSTLNALADLRGGITRISQGTLALTDGAAIPGGINDATLGELNTTIDIRSGGTYDVSGTTTTASTAALQQIIGTGTIVGNYNHSQGRLRPGDAPFGDSNLTTSGAGKLTFVNNLNVSGGTIHYDLAPAGLVGDYSQNGTVDAADYTRWRDALGSNAALPNRDPANSGAIGPADFESWKARFGQTGGGSSEVIQVGGGNLSGNAVIDIGVLPGAAAGTYTVINSATPLTGSIAGWTVNWTGRGSAPTLVQTANQVQLNATSLIPPATVNWRGDQNANWDAGAAGTSNWRNTSTNSADKFFTLDTAQFLDTYDGTNAPTTTAVTLNQSVSPASVIVNSSLDYTISGTGRISGGASLVKQGTGRLTITTNNNYSGGTTISGGIVDLEATGVLGSREITLAGGQLRAGVAGNFNLNNDLVINGTGNVISNDATASRTLNLNRRISGSGHVVLANDSGAGTAAPGAVNGIDLFGDNSGFTGSVSFGASGDPAEQAGVFLRFRNAISQGTNVAWDLGNNGSTLSQRIDVATPTTFVLGSLAGGPQSAVSGFGSGANPGGASIWQVGSLNTSTEFAGVISDGNVASNPAKTSALTKVGTGTLTLSGTNTYTGDTRVQGGTLRTTTASVLADMTAVIMSAGTTLNLDFDSTSLGADTVRGLVIPGTAQAIGTWGRIGHPTAQFRSAFITGNGLLNVTAIIAPGVGSLDVAAVPEPASALLVLSMLGMLTCTRRWRRCA